MNTRAADDHPEGHDYLWSGQGARDPEVAQLERLLGRYALGEAPPLHLPVSRPSRSPAWGAAIAAAAAILLVWGVQLTRGSALTFRVTGDGTERFVTTGDSVRARDAALTLEIADIGEVELAAGSRLVVEEIREAPGAGRLARHALSLREGSLSASIFAEPRVFQVGTPAGWTIDLGCEYRLTVRPDGKTRLDVDTGQVAFAHEGHEVYVPAGAWCLADPERGPSPAMFASTSAERRDFLLEVWRRGDIADPQELGALCSYDDREAALPLFALMTDLRMSARVRAALFERLSGTFERPAGVTRERILAGDAEAREAWIDEASWGWR